MNIKSNGKSRARGGLKLWRITDAPLKYTVLLFLILVTCRTAFSATLTHRYPFDADASDAVGGANGTLQGAAFVTNGALTLNGSNSFVTLPGGLFTNDNSESFEIWYADASINNSNAFVFAFTGPQGGASYSLFGAGRYVSNNVTEALNLPAVAAGGTNHVVFTQDSASQTARLYVNGLLAAENTNFTLTLSGIGATTTNCVGGMGNLLTSLNFNGTVLEFRTYLGAMSPLDVAVSDAFGPDQPQTDPGTLQAIRLIVPPSGPGAAFYEAVFADFTGVTNVNISSQPDLVVESDNTNVISILPDGRLDTLTNGTADITAIWRGMSNTVAVAVGVPQDVALIHRYSFSEKTNDWILHDSVGNANGRLYAFQTTPVPNSRNGAFTGNGQLQLTGAAGPIPPPGAYVALPPRMVSGLDEVSIEAWLTWKLRTTWPWQRVFDFGNAVIQGQQASGVTYLFLTTEANTFATNDVARFTISADGLGAETPRLDWTNILPLNVPSFVAVTYSPVRHTAKFYLNGQLISSGTATIPLSATVDDNCWLGRSQYSIDSYLGALYDEFRIYKGMLSDADVAADLAAGSTNVGSDFVLHEFQGTNAMTVTWGPSASNLVLQTSPTLGGQAEWSNVAAPVVFQNGRFDASVTNGGNSAFYRLGAP